HSGVRPTAGRGPPVRPPRPAGNPEPPRRHQGAAMRFVTYQHDGHTELGVRPPEGIVATGYPGLREYLAADAPVPERLVAAGPPTVTPDRILSPIPDRA